MQGQAFIKPLDWGYPVNYGKENEYEYDVVIIGGGLAGSNAAIAAKKKGAAKVALLDKGPVVRSGSGGTGFDHWHSVHTNPASKVNPDEAIELYKLIPWFGGRFGMSHMRYIECQESWNCLMEMEKLGVPIRDMDDEFKGAPFRDDKTKLMYAYDYEKRTVVRMRGGAIIKPLLNAEVERLGVDIYNFVMGVSLLTEGGKQGAKVIGCTALSLRTGEFYIFKAKSVILATGKAQGYWNQFYETMGTPGRFHDPNDVGDAQVMAFKAGAEVTNLEGSGHGLAAGPFGYHPYICGNVSNTWYGGRLIDANGTVINYIDMKGNVISGADINRGQMGVGSAEGFIEQDVPERILSGDLKLPFYIDFPGMDPMERRALWGLMVGNEGKTNYSVYKMYNKYGFDPEKDMIQVPIMEPEAYRGFCWWNATSAVCPPQLREQLSFASAIVTNWDLQTTLEGLYAAGYNLGNFYAAGAITTGRYAGRHAADRAKTVGFTELNRKQIDDIKKEVYVSATRKEGIGWKEYKQGLARNMQENRRDKVNEDMLKNGLAILDNIKNSEGQELFARNPHELARIQECRTFEVMCELIFKSAMERKNSNTFYDLNRMDYPEKDSPEWDKYITFKEIDGKMVIGERPLEYWLKGDNASSYKENYEKHKSL